eukprot:Polyplicarium_translucidae@DN3388_c4_g3_i2.p3
MRRGRMAWQDRIARDVMQGDSRAAWRLAKGRKKRSPPQPLKDVNGVLQTTDEGIESVLARHWAKLGRDHDGTSKDVSAWLEKGKLLCPLTHEWRAQSRNCRKDQHQPESTENRVRKQELQG